MTSMRACEHHRSSHVRSLFRALHLMTHKPKNPFCEACIRAKKVEAPSYKGSYVKTAQEWGQKVTADHITSLKDSMLGITGDRDALTIKDESSGLKNLYPTKTKNVEETEMAIREFAGDDNS